ncbi:MAG: hypothetical protein JWQ78_377, partial [Sediminibacterium sp.]|nr:hypothetical protein [Sediminibacterium sp.]
MKKNYFYIGMLLAGIALIAATKPFGGNPYGFTTGTPAIQSVSALSFGKNGILFIGDSKSASIFAVDTKDARNNVNPATVSVANIDQKIAAALG